MSQECAAPASAVSLEELSGWPGELCRQELLTVLSAQALGCESSKNYCRNVFTSHEPPDIGADFLFTNAAKTVKLFDDMMCELTSQGRELSSQNLEIQTSLRNILQTMVQVLGALTGCVQHICATQASIVLENIPSLPASVLHVVRSTFVHCKSLKHQAVVKSQLKHREIVTSLCEDLLGSFQSCLQLAEQVAQSGAQDDADYRLFQKTLKLCCFFASSLLHYTKRQ